MRQHFTLCLIIVSLVLGISLAARAFTFSDNFDSPDGPVGNGWSTWWDGAFDDSHISLVGGELQTYGFISQAGGIFRSLPVTFPLTFSFDFRTESTGDQCHYPPAPHNDGGWLIVFNAEPVSSPPPYNATNQLTFYQYAGSLEINRAYQTESGPVSDSVPVVSGQRDFGPSSLAHITSSHHRGSKR